MKLNCFAPAIIILFGLMLSVTVFVVTRSWEWQDIEIKFERLIDNNFASLRRELDLSIEVLFGLKGLFEASNFVSRQEFKTFTMPQLANHPSIQALEWIPKVTAEQRSVYEAAARADGFSTFQFTERHQQGKMVPASARAEYFPVFYLEPYKSNKTALGFDLGSNLKRLEALTQSCDTNKMLVTSRIKLVQEPDKQFGFLIFAPIYEEKAKTCSNLKGFVLGVYRIGDILEKALNYAGISNIQANLWLYEEEQLLHFRNSGSLSDTRLKYEKHFKVVGRDWKLVAHPTTEYVAFSHILYSYAFLVIGLLFTILLAAYLRQRLSELRESREHTWTIVKTVVNGIITINQHGIIEFINPATERLFGYSMEEIIGQNVKMLMPEPYSSKHDDYLKNYLKTGKSKIIDIGREAIGRRKNGTTFPIYLAVSELRLKQKRKFIGIITDITERKKTEQILIQAKEKAEESNRLKSEFLNIISHELRTPLTVMLGNLPLLSDVSDLPEPDEIVEIVEDIEDSSKHLLTLINDLLDISKIEAGKMKLTKESFSLNALFKDMKIAALAEKKGLILELLFDQNLTITADPVRLKQILFNLLGNAIKFTDKGKISVKVTQEKGMTFFSIQDAGCGMREEDLPYIFEMFRQVDGSSKRAASGTGLGLAITKRLVEMHKGQITVTSQIGVGSTFTFSIPIEV